MKKVFTRKCPKIRGVLPAMGMGSPEALIFHDSGMSRSNQPLFYSTIMKRQLLKDPAVHLPSFWFVCMVGAL